MEFELKEGAEPIFSRPYPVPKVHEEILEKELEHLVLIGFLEVANGLELRSPSFAQPKLKSNQVLFLSDFRNINKQLKRKPYPVPKINDILLKLEGFSILNHLV